MGEDGCVTVQVRIVSGGSGRPGGAAPDEAAAIVAAVSRFAGDTAAPGVRGADSPGSGWLRTARLEAVARDPAPRAGGAEAIWAK